ncbi:MAG TPA: ATP-grasp domain-containing protein [Syntrophales bacterium]|nr:ATP-grasp domain-containing protein [Syntrophales bacterium]
MTHRETGLTVGLVYDLRDDYLAEGYSEEETAEFDRAETIDAIEATLRSLSYRTDRIGHARSLVGRLAAGARWDLVFNIAEGLRGYGRESLVPALLEAYGIPYVFSDPLVLSLTLHKGMCKRVVRDLAIPTPDFAVVEKEADIAAVGLPFPLFVKPVAEGTGKGITGESVIHSPGALERICRRLLGAYGQPVLVERFLPGREFTVGVVGTGEEAETVGVMEVLLLAEAEKEVYSYINKEYCERLVRYRLADDGEARRAAAVALAAWRGLGCRDGGRVDIRSDERGEPHFMEVNPLAGLHPEHSDLPILCTLGGISYRDLLGRIMDSALRRTAAGNGGPGP